STLTDRVVATAKHEAAQVDANTWQPKNSVATRVLDMLGVMPANEAEARTAVKALGEMPASKLATFMRQNAERISNSSLAKEIVRGADVVRQVQPKNVEGTKLANTEARDGSDMYRMDVGARGTPQKAEAPGETSGNGRARVHGKDVPANTADVVQQWAKTIEKTSGRVLPDTVHLMTPDEAAARYGVPID